MRFLLIRNEKGFSFLESIFQLMILSVFLSLVIVFFYWKAPIERQFGNYKNTEWELFAIDFQKLVEDVTDLNISDAGDELTFRIGTDRFSVGAVNSVVRWQRLGTGYMAMLTDVRSIRFSHDGFFVTASVVMLNGERKERSFAIGSITE